MKILLNILIPLLIFTSCGQRNDSAIVASKTTNLSVDSSIQDLNFHITGLTEENFKIVKSGDTTFYLKQLYEGIDGKEIKFDQNTIKDLEVRIQLTFGFLQYTIDDSPAYPLSYNKTSKWVNLESKKGQILIPDFYGNSSNPKVYEILGHSDNSQLINWIETEDFEQLKTESYKEQTVFFNKLINNKTQYENCCPEYIEQANTFLKSKKTDFNSIDGLGLELIYKKITIELNGYLANGEKFHKVIIEKV
jgi:hypothetical protein